MLTDDSQGVVSHPESLPHLLAPKGEVQSHNPSSRPRGADTVRSYSANVILQLVVAAQQSCRAEDAARLIAEQLRQSFDLDSVAVGTQARWGSGCRLIAVSGVSKIDRRTDHCRALEAAMDEALQRDELTSWPPHNDEDARALTHRSLTACSQSSAAITLPLRMPDGERIGAVTLLGYTSILRSVEIQDFLNDSQQALTGCLRLLSASRGRLTPTDERRGYLKNKIAWSCVVLGAFAALAIPVPHRVACDVELQPVSRRFVAAPFEGVLEESLREPGDLVSKGEILARIDGRELRLEVAGLQAEYEQAKKEREVALAKGAGADAQVARLEMRSVESKLRLLKDREQTLEIRSPLDGVVVSGDLQRVEGAPLSTGKALFEIAPLTQMVVEIAIPEKNIAYVRRGFPVTVELTAFSARKWFGKVTRIHPRSELIDNESVFVAELTVDNPNRELQPGMNGRARISCGKRWLGWTLFHRPIEALLMRLGW